MVLKHITPLPDLPKLLQMAEVLQNSLPQLFRLFFVEFLLLAGSDTLESDSNLGLLLIDSEFTAL